MEESIRPDPALTTLKSKTWETTVGRVESWPEEAKPLKKHTGLSLLLEAGDFILLLLPIYFMRKRTGHTNAELN